MLYRMILVAVLALCGLQVLAEDLKSVPDKVTLERSNIERSREITLKPETLVLAKSIVDDLVKDHTQDEILGMVKDIAQALSDEDLCGTEAIQSMMDVGISFETSYDAVVKACHLDGPQLAELNRSLSPGLAGSGGSAGGIYVGREVSP